MKRDVCVDAFDKVVPAVRFRPVFGHESAYNARKHGASSYEISSSCTNSPPRPHPRAYASTPRVNRSSPAIPPHFNSSVQASFAHLEHVLIDEGCNP